MVASDDPFMALRRSLVGMGVVGPSIVAVSPPIWPLSVELWLLALIVFVIALVSSAIIGRSIGWLVLRLTSFRKRSVRPHISQKQAII